MLITSFRVEGFRSINEVSINLTRVNLLAGKNNTGKSNVMRALDLLANIDEKCTQIAPEDFNPNYRTIECEVAIQLTARDKRNLLSGIDTAKKQILPKPVSDFVNNSYPRLIYRVHVNRVQTKRPAFALLYKKKV